MADNTQLNAGTGGDVVASDDISGVKHQRVKVEFGADGSATDVSPTAGLPVKDTVLSLSGSITSSTGSVVASTDVSGYNTILMFVDSGSGIVQFQFSMDNTNWIAVQAYKPQTTQDSGTNIFPSSTAGIYFAPVVGRYFRLQMTSSGSVVVTGQATTRELNTVAGGSLVTYSGSTNGTGVPVIPYTFPNSDAQASISYGFATGNYTYNGSTWDRERAYTVLTGTASATGTSIASTDVSQFGTVIFQTVGGSGSNSFNVQFSNDNTNWSAANGVASHNASYPDNTPTLVSGMGQVVVPVAGRYMRVQCTTYVSGTSTITVNLVRAPILPFGYRGLPVNVENAVYLNGATWGSVSSDGLGTNSSLYVNSYPLVYNGASWEKARTPNVFKTATATASGNTAVWTPASGKKFRLMRYMIEVTNASTLASAADLDIKFQDATTDVGVGNTLYVPTAAGTALGSYSTGWIDLGNGKLSAAANNVLNINLSAALTAGKVRVTVCGVEE